MSCFHLTEYTRSQASVSRREYNLGSRQGHREASQNTEDREMACFRWFLGMSIPIYTQPTSNLSTKGSTLSLAYAQVRFGSAQFTSMNLSPRLASLIQIELGASYCG